MHLQVRRHHSMPQHTGCASQHTLCRSQHVAVFILQVHMSWFVSYRAWGQQRYRVVTGGHICCARGRNVTDTCDSSVVLMRSIELPTYSYHC